MLSMQYFWCKYFFPFSFRVSSPGDHLILIDKRWRIYGRYLSPVVFYSPPNPLKLPRGSEVGRHYLHSCHFWCDSRTVGGLVPIWYADIYCQFFMGGMIGYSQGIPVNQILPNPLSCQTTKFEPANNSTLKVTNTSTGQAVWSLFMSRMILLHFHWYPYYPDTSKKNPFFWKCPF